MKDEDEIDVIKFIEGELGFDIPTPTGHGILIKPYVRPNGTVPIYKRLKVGIIMKCGPECNQLPENIISCHAGDFVTYYGGLPLVLNKTDFYIVYDYQVLGLLNDPEEYFKEYLA